MNKYLAEAQAMYEELLANRHYLHQHAEIMDELPVTTAFVKEKLTEYGIEFEEISKCDLQTGIQEYVRLVDALKNFSYSPS